MTTEDIAHALKLTAQLMELHGDNPFKVKSLSNAAYRLDKTGIDLAGKSLEELEQIEGIGKGIAQKIIELEQHGVTKELQALLDKTPAGVIEMLGVKGIGPKKVAQLWKELEVESVGELLYACHENRLVDLKGFGTKTQEQVRKAIEFNMGAKGKFHYATAEATAQRLVEFLKAQCKTELVSLAGAVRRKCEIVESIEAVVAFEGDISLDDFENHHRVPVGITQCTAGEFYTALLTHSASPEHLEQLETAHIAIPANAKSEEAGFAEMKLQYIEPELREGRGEILLAQQNKIPQLVEMTDLRGILHNHSTWSDGMHTLQEMAEHCKKLDYDYLGICDHSQSAFYANGLKADRVAAQQEEIDALNKKLAPFRIFKGIESDILHDGSLDYPEEILKTFDFIVGSVHSGLKMDKEKATTRLLRAIENPYTTILGHPTGRLLLSREGYPVDHKKIIDACAANQVIIELNAHPYRLDIDWRWIPYCLEKGVQISINPDAHEKDGLLDMYYGVCVARKGMLTKDMCFNALSGEEISKYFTGIKKKKGLS
ncbi:MAG: DNA polymerase (family X) [Bacteroidetes bacterium]|nr:MAG: DNA polymerase (family X) [Bacteroidota bacterium]